MIIHSYDIILAIQHTNTRDTYIEIDSQPPDKDEIALAGKHNCFTPLNDTASGNPTASDVQNKSLEITINGEKAQASNSKTVESTQEKLMR